MPLINASCKGSVLKSTIWKNCKQSNFNIYHQLLYFNNMDVMHGELQRKWYILGKDIMQKINPDVSRNTLLKNQNFKTAENTNP